MSTTTTALNPYQMAILAAGAVAFWPLDDTIPPSTTARELVTSAPGTVVGGVVVASDPFGTYDSQDFDGETGFIYSSGFYQDNSKQFSDEIWYRTIDPTVGVFCFKGSPAQGPTVGTGTPQVFIDTNGCLNVYASGLTTTTLTDPHPSNDGYWHHAVITWNPTSANLHLYRDGKRVGTSVGGVMQLVAGFRPSIGACTTARNGFFAGSLSSMACYGRVLSATEIANHFALGSPSGIVSPPPLFYPSPEVLTLQNDNATLDLTQVYQNGIAISQKDFGAPVVREVTYDHPSMDGTDDQTRYLTQRVVNLTGMCFSQPGQSRSKAYNLLQPFLDPTERSTLVYALDEDVEPVMLTGLRVATISRVTAAPTAFTIQLQWKADPVALSLVQKSVVMQPSGQSGQGRVYNLRFNRMYPTITGQSPVVITSGGTYKTWLLLRIYGPCTNPEVTWTPPGGVDDLPGQVGVLMTVPSGNYLEIDTQARTVLMGGPGGTNEYQYVDFANTVWSPIYPGNNTVTFLASNTSSPCQLAVLWNDGYL